MKNSILIIISSIVLSGCANNSALKQAEEETQVSNNITIAIEPVVKGLSSPVAITHAGDGSGRLFITLQSGKVHILKQQALIKKPFLDISDRVTCCGEQGLLSIAFHPKYKDNGFVFANYTDKSGDTTIARYKVSSDPNLITADSEKIILKIKQTINIHNGGQLQFGPQGYLYIGMGDGGSVSTSPKGDSGGDPHNYAQRLDVLLGKMLRINVDDETYSIPKDNPYVNVIKARDEIWASGLRNPWRFSFDRLTGDLYIADVGEKSREEVNFQKADSKGGENYGWRLMEGSLCSGRCQQELYTLPVVEYDHSSGCAITGGYVYRGNLYPRLFGLYLYADYCLGAIRGASQAVSGKWEASTLLDMSTNFGGLRVSSFGESEDGELYVAHHDDNDGIIYKIVDPQMSVSEK